VHVVSGRFLLYSHFIYDGGVPEIHLPDRVIKGWQNVEAYAAQFDTYGVTNYTGV